MDLAGYSGTPLLKKLGIKPESRVIYINAPDTLVEPLGPLPRGREADFVDVILLFCLTQVDLVRHLAELSPRLDANGSLWVAWPKKASRINTDLTENDLRTLVLPTGLVDNKVCAIDETWSGLRFVVRVENRKSWPTVP